MYQIYTIFWFLLAQKWMNSTHRCGVLDPPPFLMLVLSCCSSIQRWWGYHPKVSLGALWEVALSFASGSTEACKS